MVRFACVASKKPAHLRFRHRRSSIKQSRRNAEESYIKQAFAFGI
jgi:hypothetical protein